MSNNNLQLVASIRTETTKKHQILKKALKKETVNGFLRGKPLHRRAFKPAHLLTALTNSTHLLHILMPVNNSAQWRHAHLLLWLVGRIIIFTVLAIGRIFSVTAVTSVLPVLTLVAITVAITIANT